ncbi:HAD-IA family hydrolase [Epibacterium sp. SM1979]|uniref:phosphoglycolate phosphatase n=1 Tax=Tritonibacter litoralis TaxID=2662264 RepID=A0A843YCG5_9RHOB|nr:HAD-IA family hydrolase [Tritonibacter litoralis]MQQ07578.1 HAD-IA family hydrolase [Tritonibacter litoralis]
MRTVIFDLDGTLADTSGDLLAAANACFRQMGHGDVLVHPGDAGVALRGGRRMLTVGLERVGAFSDAVVDEFYPVLLDAYRSAIDTHTVLYPGVLSAIEELKTRGYGIGICTNKPEALAEQLMQSLGVREVFGALVGADTLPVRKPDPAPLVEAVRRLGGDPAQTVLIGDSDTDRNTSANAGVPSILVGFGPSGADMAALKPEGLISHFDELPDRVDQVMAAHLAI